MFDAVVRKSGNSLIVTIPKDEAEHLGLREGSHVRVSAVRLDRRPVLPPDLQEAMQEMLADREFVAGLRWLKEQDAGPENAAPDAPPWRGGSPAPSTAGLMPVTGEGGEVAYVTAAEVQAIHVVVMEATDQSPAPLRDADLLEGAVRRPEMAAHYAGAGLFEQAAILAVAISQAQAFADGNKRTAIASCRAFLHRNGRPFRRTNPALFRTLVDAAEARDVGRRLALATLARLLREGCAAGPESGRPGR